MFLLIVIKLSNFKELVTTKLFACLARRKKKTEELADWLQISVF